MCALLSEVTSFVAHSVVDVGSVVVGKAQMYLPPCTFDIEVTLRDAPTLPPQPERQPYQRSPPLYLKPAFYAGDFHVHSRESGDAFLSATVDEIASYAQSVRCVEGLLVCVRARTPTAWLLRA